MNINKSVLSKLVFPWKNENELAVDFKSMLKTQQTNEKKVFFSYAKVPFFSQQYSLS
jgi:hypothetical protein